MGPISNNGLNSRKTEDVQRWFLKYADRLYTFIFYKVRNADLAADLVQETFLVALEKIDKYEPGRGKMYVWLCFLARDRVKRALREKRRYVSSNPDELEFGTILPCGKQLTEQPLPEDILDRVETADLVQMALGSISERYREVLEQYYFRQMTIRQIAAARGIGVGGARLSLYRAKKAFMRMLRKMTKSVPDTFYEKGAE